MIIEVDPLIHLRHTQVETRSHYVSRSSLLELFQSSFLLTRRFSFPLVRPNREHSVAVSNRERERTIDSPRRNREREKNGRLTSRAERIARALWNHPGGLASAKVHYHQPHTLRRAPGFPLLASNRVHQILHYVSSKVAVRLHRNHRPRNPSLSQQETILRKDLWKEFIEKEWNSGSFLKSVTFNISSLSWNQPRVESLKDPKICVEFQYIGN